MIFDVDVRGGLSIKRLYPRDALTIFIEPPDREVLRRRLLQRGTETPQQIQIRLDRVDMELREGKGYEFHVVNDVLEKAVADVDAVIANALARR